LAPDGAMLTKDAPRIMSKRAGNLLAKRVHSKGLKLIAYDRYVDDKAAANYWGSLATHDRWSLCGVTSEQMLNWCAKQYTSVRDLVKLRVHKVGLGIEFGKLFSKMAKYGDVWKGQFETLISEASYWQPILKYLATNEGAPVALTDLIDNSFELPSDLTWEIIANISIDIPLSMRLPGLWQIFVNEYAKDAALHLALIKSTGEQEFIRCCSAIAREATEYLIEAWPNLLRF
jgi:hypothetical protein